MCVLRLEFETLLIKAAPDVIVESPSILV